MLLLILRDRDFFFFFNPMIVFDKVVAFSGCLKGDNNFLKLNIQGSRVRPIWSHVHPNFSRVRLTKIPGRTGASSHSRKEKKSIRDSETLWFNKRHPR